MNLANKLTLLRVFMTPAIVIGLLQKAPVWPGVVFLLSALTDIADGAVARWRGERTVLGSYLDPLADKTLNLSVLSVLAFQGLVPLWVVIVIWAKDLWVFSGWALLNLLTGEKAVRPRPLGKAATFLQTVAVTVHIYPFFADARGLALWAAAVGTSLAMVDYTWVGAARVRHLS